MCGINGVIRFDGRPVMCETLHDMNDEMVHRGPGDEGIWVGRQVGLGQRRLTVSDTVDARQPLVNEDETMAMVCDGEIYNDRLLRNELIAKGHQFQTADSAEIILHLFEEYGPGCVHHLRSDRETFIGSSELKSILAVCGEKLKMDLQSMMYYLTLQYVPDPRTMVDGICTLPPGHCVRIKGEHIHIKQYWSPQFEETEEPENVIKENILKSLRHSVQMRMRNDVPKGCFLSSGIDSTTIAAFMRELEHIHTFSVSFEGENNECLISRRTAAELKTRHHEWTIEEQQYFEAVENCIWHQDDPVADPAAIALYAASQLASEFVGVVFSGEGADELFGGYGIYREPKALRALQWMPQPLKEAIQPIVKSLPNFYGKNY